MNFRSDDSLKRRIQALVALYREIPRARKQPGGGECHESRQIAHDQVQSVVDESGEYCDGGVRGEILFHTGGFYGVGCRAAVDKEGLRDGGGVLEAVEQCLSWGADLAEDLLGD